MTAEPFILDLAANPHRDLLELALTARRRARIYRDNLAASAYYIGVLHACTAATGCDESEMVAWLDHHDSAPLPAWVPAFEAFAVLDVAVRARRIARAGGGEPMVYLRWAGMIDLLVEALGLPPDGVDAFIAACDPDPDVEVPSRALPGHRVDIRHT